jgi:threonine/homoserine/homoserine lactone efflux protein
VITYAALIVAVHTVYASMARSARRWLGSPAGGRLVNRAGGLTFMGFGLALARATR